MHHCPKPAELVTIVLQISRFLKEFSEFETKKTPCFRHPLIIGKTLLEKNPAILKINRENVVLGIREFLEIYSSIPLPEELQKGDHHRKNLFIEEDSTEYSEEKASERSDKSFVG